MTAEPYLVSCSPGASRPGCIPAATATARRANSVESAAFGPPVDQPYGVREYGARDLEGHLWFFHGPLR